MCRRNILIKPGKYLYRLKQIDNNGNFNYSNNIEVEINNIISYKLEQNYPNPFNPETKIKYGIEKTGFVSLKVYDILGKEVTSLVNQVQNEGEYEIDPFGTRTTTASRVQSSFRLSGSAARTFRSLPLTSGGRPSPGSRAGARWHRRHWPHSRGMIGQETSASCRTCWRRLPSPSVGGGASVLNSFRESSPARPLSALRRTSRMPGGTSRRGSCGPPWRVRAAVEPRPPVTSGSRGKGWRNS